MNFLMAPIPRVKKKDLVKTKVLLPECNSPFLFLNAFEVFLRYTFKWVWLIFSEHNCLVITPIY